jgi:hypothetical protein
VNLPPTTFIKQSVTHSPGWKSELTAFLSFKMLYTREGTPSLLHMFPPLSLGICPWSQGLEPVKPLKTMPFLHKTTYVR